MIAINAAVVRQVGTDEEQSKHRDPAPTPKEINGGRP